METYFITHATFTSIGLIFSLWYADKLQAKHNVVNNVGDYFIITAICFICPYVAIILTFAESYSLGLFKRKTK